MTFFYDETFLCSLIYNIWCKSVSVVVIKRTKEKFYKQDKKKSLSMRMGKLSSNIHMFPRLFLPFQIEA